MKPTFPKNIQSRKTWIVLGVAISIGVVAALAARNYIASQMAALEARNKTEQANVLVAKRQLQKGTRLSSENVAVRSIPVEYAPTIALRPDDFNKVDGAALAFDVKPGDLLFAGLVEGRKYATFSERVAPGRRAITVPVDEINSISGLLEPGDTVDLLVTVEQKNRKITFPILQSALVIATGQRAVDDPKSGERRQYSTATLDTTPQQAQRVIAAREAGKITALLRNPGDKTILGKTNSDLASLLGTSTDAASNTDESGVPVIYGGRGGKIPVEGLVLPRFARLPDMVDSEAAPTPTPTLSGGVAAAKLPDSADPTQAAPAPRQ